MNKIIITIIFMIGFENLLQASWCSAISCSFTPIEYLQQDKDLKDGFHLIDKNYEEFINRYVYFGDYQKQYADQEIKAVRTLVIKTISDGMSHQLQAILKILNQKGIYIVQLEKKDKDILYYAIAHKSFSFNIDPIFEEIFGNVRYNSYILDLIKKHFTPKNYRHIISKAEFKLSTECLYGNNLDMIQFLIYYVNVNRLLCNGLYDSNKTPLMLVACRNINDNDLEIAKCLIAHGADIYARDRLGYTAEKLAYQYKNHKIAHFLTDENTKRQIRKEREENRSCNIS